MDTTDSAFEALDIAANPFADDLDLSMSEIPDLSPGEAAVVERFVAYAVARTGARQKRARKKEEPASSPSKKISIRLPRPLMELLREQAALAGMPYQSFIKAMLYDVATR